MDVAGLAFAVAGVANTWVDLVDLISTAWRISEDLDGFITHVESQRVIFWLWCIRTGMQDAAHQIQSGVTPNTIPARAPLDVRKLLPSGPVQDPLMASIGNNMKLMDRALGDIQTFLTSYGATAACQTRNRLQKPSPRGDQSNIVGFIRRDLRQTAARNAAAASTRKDSFWDAARWAASGKTESTSLLNELKRCNDVLLGFLGLMDPDGPQRFQRTMHMSIPSTSLGRGISQLSPSGAADSSQPLAQVCQMAERQKEVGSLEIIDDGRLVESTTSAAALQGVPPTPPGGRQSLLMLNPKNFDLFRHEGDVPPERQRGTYKNEQAVVVEWRYYSKRLSPEGRDLLQHRISLLVLQLRQSSSVPGFLTPHCLGFFHCAAEGRYGIAFEIPPGASSADGPRSLQRYLSDDKKNNNTFSRGLPARLRLARQLALAMFQFLSVGWIHKNMRSSSVLFFDDAGPSPHSLPDASLLGFGFARMEAPTAQTELNPSTLRGHQQSTAWRLYCHPDRDRALMRQGGGVVGGGGGAAADPQVLSSSSTMYHDAYGLGIVLLEIALWVPVTKLCGHKSVEEFQRDVATKYVQLLQFHVGDRYAQVVRRLLVGDFGLDPAAGGEDGSDGEDHGEDDKRVMFLEAFERTVVTELEQALK